MMLGGSDTSRGKTNSNNIINDLLSRPNAPVSADISESLQMKIWTTMANCDALEGWKVSDKEDASKKVEAEASLHVYKIYSAIW